MKVEGKTAVITGGAGGLGRAIVRELQAGGAAVFVLDVRAEAPEGGASAFVCDLTDPVSTSEAIGSILRERPSIDVLVNCAGLIGNAPLIRVGPTGFERHDLGLWNRLIAANLTSVFVATACVVERMLERRTSGVVVNVSSVVANGNPGQSAYAAAKAGVNSLTHTWARELGALGIRVAAVAPGYTDTPSTRGAMGDGALKDVVARTPLRRMASPEEVADAVMFVIRNDFFHGRVLAIDGGLTP